MKCPICQHMSFSTLYEGPVRLGKPGNLTAKNYTIQRCEGCESAYLDNSDLDYESEEYRALVQSDPSIEKYYEIHDKQQPGHLRFVDLHSLRGLTLADIGCGGGSFLDVVSGLAGQTLAVEPSKHYHDRLRSAGHSLYPFASEALPEWQGKVDAAFSFAVIEHVQDALNFVKEIRQLLKPGGYLLLSTPNSRDWLLDFLPGVYDKFFYRYVHCWYFTETSLRKIGELAGFERVEIHYQHEYDLSNALLWARDDKPTGLGKFPLFEDLNGIYQQHLEARGVSNYLYAKMYA